MSSHATEAMPQLIPPPDQVMQVLTKTGAFRQGHFVYPRGEHTPHYFQLPLALRNYQAARELGVAISRLLRGVQEVSSALPRIALISPGSGGIPLAFNAQVALGAELIYWAEKEDGRRRFRQYVQLQPGTSCVIVDDILRTGSAMTETTKMVEEMGGEVVAYATVVHFTTAPADFNGVPVLSLVEFETQWYKDEASCPLCQQGIPVEAVRF